MSKVKIQGNASGTGVVTLTAPNTNTDRTITLPDDTQTLIGTNSSGNVGIGTSSPIYRLDVHSPAGAVPAHFNQTGTTNDIARFDKDGVRKLSISPDGIKFNGDTAAANALDDYEEGTFTPAYYSSGGGETVTHDIQQGRYTKVGDLVTIHILVGTDAISGGSSNCRISGLPFTASQTASTSVGLGYGFLSTGPRYVLVNNLSSSLQLYPTHGSATQLPWASLNTNSNDNRLYITMSYWAT